MTHLDEEGKKFKSVSFESSHSSLEKQSEERGCHLPAGIGRLCAGRYALGCLLNPLLRLIVAIVGGRG